MEENNKVGLFGEIRFGLSKGESFKLRCSSREEASLCKAKKVLSAQMSRKHTGPKAGSA